MKREHNLVILALLLACLTCHVSAETVYFLVAEITPYENHSYVLPLSEPNDIAHARALIKFGPSIGRSTAIAEMNCGADGINRNFVARSKPAWAWHVTNFVEFNSVVTIFDGSPVIVQNDCEWWMNNKGGQIGFLNYTVVAELGTDPNHWKRNFNSDEDVDFDDFAWVGMHWWQQDCNQPDRCNGTDLDNSGTVDLSDLAIFMESWLSPFADEPWWFECWGNPRQCHGDADGSVEGTPMAGLYWVGVNDLYIFHVVWTMAETWPLKCGDINYVPDVDFDRDCDVDDIDGFILQTWFGVKEPPNGPGVPPDCPYCP